MTDKRRPPSDPGRFRLLVIDIDGTLLDRQGRLPPANRRALGEAIQGGVGVSLSTGRPRRACLPLLEELAGQEVIWATQAPHIFFDGALVAPATGPLVHAEPLPSDQAARLVDYCRRRGLYLELYTAEGYHVEQRQAVSELHAGVLGIWPEEGPFDEVLAEEVLKGELIMPAPEYGGQRDALQTELGPTVRLSPASVPRYPDLIFVNVTSARASKGLALERLATHLKVSLAEVVAIGDGMNDVPLFQVVGLAVAVGDAPPEVRKAAHRVVAPADAGGVAEAIRGFVLGR